MDRHISRTGEPAEAGFTLVELVVALTILAVGIVGVIGVTNGSFRVAGGSSARSKMVAIATKQVEALRAIPYPDLLAAGNTFETETGTSGGLQYTVERTVSFPDSTSTADRHATALVAVRWTDPTGAHEVHQRSFLYPGGVGPQNGAATTPTTAPNCTPAKPTGLTASQVLDSTQITSTVDLSWTAVTGTCPAATYVIRYVTGVSSIVNELTRLATATTYRVTGLTAGTQYNFQVAAKSASGNLSTWSDVASVTTQATSTSTCKVGTITLTPPAINKKSNGNGAGLVAAVSVRVPTEGTCPGFTATYFPTATSSAQLTLVKQTDGAYTGTLNHNLTWDVGRRYVDVYKSGATTKSGSVLLTVCEHNVSNCS